MATEYKTVYTNTLQGLKESERLHANGWTCYSVGLFMHKYYKKSKRSEGRLQS